MTDIVEHRRRAAQTTGAYCLPGPEMVALCDEIEWLTGALHTCRELRKYDRSEIERLRALLLRHQVAAWCEEDSDLAVETRRALETKP